MEDLKNVTDMFTNRKKLPEVRVMMKKSLEEITEYCLNLREFKEVITVHMEVVPEKRPDLAKAALKEGNKLLTERNNVKAIDSYNTGIVNGSFKRNKEGRFVDNCVALCYAGRSTAAFALARYAACLRDIERAIEHGYPSILVVSILKERRVKCLIALGRDGEADLVIEECLAELKKLNLLGSASDTKASLEKLKIRNPDGSLGDRNKFEVDYTPGLDIFPTYDMPQLKEPHPKIPSLNSDVDIAVSEYKGRYLVAKKDILPGDVIVKERLFASILHDEHYKTNCSNCSSKTNFPIPCPTCNLVIFCSEDCRTSALNIFHRIECVLLPTITKLDIARKDRLALRVVITAGLEKLRESIPVYSAERNKRHPSKYGFNEQSMYLSTDYRTIYNLTTNKEKKTINSTLPSCIRAYKLIKLLENTSFFNANCVEDRKVIYHALLIHLMNTHSNSYHIIQHSIDLTDRRIEQIVSHGISSVYGLLGHSCDANTIAIHYPSITVTRAVDFIPKGAEVTISYGANYDEQTLDDRQDFLDDIFYFKCRCPACVGAWPMKQSPYGFKELEIICKIPSHKGTDCPTDCQASLDRDTLALPELSYARAHGLHRILTVVKYDFDLHRQIIILLSKYAPRPCSDLTDCKNILRDQYNRLGHKFLSNTVYPVNPEF